MLRPTFLKSDEGKLIATHTLGIRFVSILPIYVTPQGEQKYDLEDSSFDIFIVLSCEVGGSRQARGSASTIIPSGLHCNHNGCAHGVSSSFHVVQIVTFRDEMLHEQVGK
jgi:hypothetical protein